MVLRQKQEGLRRISYFDKSFNRASKLAADWKDLLDIPTPTHLQAISAVYHVSLKNQAGHVSVIVD